MDNPTHGSDGRRVSGQRRQAPEPWASAMVAKGITSRGAPSLRELARRMEQTSATPVEREAVRAWVMGDRAGTMPTAIAQGLAAALGVSVRQVLDWSGAPTQYQGPYVPPPEAHALTPTQRRLVNGLIRALAAGNPTGQVAVDVTEDEAAGTVTFQSRELSGADDEDGPDHPDEGPGGR